MSILRSVTPPPPAQQQPDKPPQSRKQQRQSKKNPQYNPITPNHDYDINHDDNGKGNLAIATRPQRPNPTSQRISRPISMTPLTAAQPMTRLLICSLGNPGAAYAHTLHSAGHLVLSALQLSLESQPHFVSSPRAWAHGTLSAGPSYTLWKSPSLMNMSGPGVAAAWKTFSLQVARDTGSKLVVVHDELELPPGKIQVRYGGASARGHNGIKSVKMSLPAGTEWVRVGVGIGRPSTRDAAGVADWVLRKMTGEERTWVEGCVGLVEAELRRLSGGRG